MKTAKSAQSDRTATPAPRNRRTTSAVPIRKNGKRLERKRCENENPFVQNSPHAIWIRSRQSAAVERPIRKRRRSGRARKRRITPSVAKAVNGVHRKSPRRRV